MTHRCDRPESYSERESLPRPEPVNQVADGQQSHCVSGLERRVDETVLGFIPAYRVLKALISCEDAQDLGVYVIDCRRKKEHSADHPAIAPYAPADALNSGNSSTRDARACRLWRRNLG